MRDPVYETLSEALRELQKRGYRSDLSWSEVADCLVCRESGKALVADDFEIDEVHRFEGDSDPGDETVVYAVSSFQKGIKGVFLDAYGTYADPERSAVVAKLHKHLNRDQPVLKRLPALQPLSREHHHALLLCWRIKLGLTRKVEIARINDYVWHFWQGYLQAHFRLEETQVFPELGNEHPMVQRAVKEHKQIESLFTNGMRTETDFELLETMLERHIRFEERVLFPEMQLILLPDALDRIAAANRHTEIVNDWPDKFWR